MRNVSTEEAQVFIAQSTFIWHQRFQLSLGVETPGINDIGLLMDCAGLPSDLSGFSVLDVGANNGGVCFEAERRGASRVVGVDIASPEWFGFRDIANLLGSQAEYIQGSIYTLPTLLSEKFDIIVFFGVLYHLRHPLLALDNLRFLARGTVLIETAICDYELGPDTDRPLAWFYRRDELGGDGSNWFSPSIRALLDWCGSCGFDAQLMESWPSEKPSRCVVAATVKAEEPEYLGISHECPLRIVNDR
jgi:tRNA (mo5U34)-methyltransferase